jgi:hypothetical protein
MVEIEDTLLNGNRFILFTYSGTSGVIFSRPDLKS